jgi:peptidoglycan/LPS O-acetylase OafA/YrhL
MGDIGNVRVDQRWDARWVGPLGLAVGLALSALTYRFVEMPGRRLGIALSRTVHGNS